MTAIFSEALDPLTITTATFELRDAGDIPVLAAVSYAGATRTATLTPNGALNANTTYTATVKAGVADAAGNALTADINWTFSTAPVDTTAPTVLATLPATGATGIATTASITATFDEPMASATLTTTTFALSVQGGATVSAAVTYDAATRTATLSPSAALAPDTTYTATIKGGAGGVEDVAGNALASDYVWSFTTAPDGAGPCTTPCSLWDATATPTLLADPDTSAVELGVKFRSDVDGDITGIRFYKSTTNTGTHVGSLWSSTGTLLAQATFTNESASGWQQVDFSAPVAIQANTLYVASYHTDVGRYSVDGGYFAVAYNNGPLSAPADGEDGGNGLYLYGAGGFPTNTWDSANYWVDVVFTTSTGPDTTAPAVTGTSPPDGAVDVGLSTILTATFSEPMAAATVSGTTVKLELNPAGGGAAVPVPATVTYDAATRSASLTPDEVLSLNAQYTATVTGGAAGVKDLAGNALASDKTWTFTTVVSDPCATPANAVVAENCLVGNPPSEWDVNGAGDPSIQGFATDISVNAGETVSFKIDTDANDYQLDIYRMGYYGGDGAREVATVDPSATLPQNQPACLQDNTTALVDCGNWAVSASWIVPADATSGIYFAKAVRADTGGASHIVFIVRDDAGGSDMLFQTADTTWHAYNTYGGSSLYSGGPGAQGGAHKVSYNRPFNTRSVDNGQDWLFNAEYPMVRWLEANGYDVSYFTGVDTDRFGSLIPNHKVFLSVGHDEYWSGDQRANVEAARDAGVHLAFFSGNEVFWKTRWEDSIDGSGTPYRSLVCYKETHANAVIDPAAPIWTGTWRDPRFSPPADGGQPENALTGTIFTVNAGATTSIQVPEADGKMRFWRNTDIASLAAGQTATLPFGTLGYEWDEDLDNGFRPDGLIRMSTTVVAGAPVLVDFGSTFGSGTATHHLTLYKHSSGALVFGSGTVQWPWGLDANHDRAGTPVDLRMQQATVNLFADMAAQPARLQTGLVAATASTDATAPSSTISSPAPGANLPQGSPVTITGTATDAGGGVVGGVEVSVDGGATWHPADGRASWSYDWTTPSASGSVTIKSRAADDSGNLETPSAGIDVTVGSGGDTTPPTVPGSLTATATSATAIDLAWLASTDNVGVTGYEVERCAGAGCINFALVTTVTGTAYADSGLTASTTYRYRVRATDAAGNLSGYSPEATATTQAGADAQAPTVPGSLTATATSATTIDLSWPESTDNVGVTGYQVERCQGAGCSSFAAVTTVTGTAYADSGLTASTTYGFRVRATDAAGNLSGYSPDATITTQAASQPVGLVAAYAFDEGTGNIVSDASGNGHTGSITGATWVVSGRFGQALSFNGTSDWITIADANDLDPTTGMTVSAWVNPNVLSNWRTVIIKERPNGLSYALYGHDNAPRPAAYVNTGGADTSAPGASGLSADTWTHLAATYDGAGLQLYVNGNQVSSQAVAGIPVASASPLRIGGNSVWGEYFAGLIDEVRVYNRALSAAEIQADLGNSIAASTSP